MMKTFILILSCLLFSIEAKTQVGINTLEPKGALHVVADKDMDVLVLSGMKTVDDVPNEIDGTNASYMRLKISQHGVLRREALLTSKTSSLYLASTVQVPKRTTQDAGSILSWITEANNVANQYIPITEDGTYIFSMQMYVNISKANTSDAIYVSTFKEGSNTAIDTQEVFVSSVSGVVYPSNLYVVTCNATVMVTANAGERVYLKISKYTDSFNFQLKSSSGGGTRTSLYYWKI